MADFYAARSRTIPPLPWTNFTPPLSISEVRAFSFRTSCFPRSHRYHGCISHSPATTSGTKLTAPSNGSGQSELTASIQTTSNSLSVYYCRNAHGAPIWLISRLMRPSLPPGIRPFGIFPGSEFFRRDQGLFAVLQSHRVEAIIHRIETRKELRKAGLSLRFRP